MKNFNRILKDIDKIEGLLVPGQERILYSLASFFKNKPTIVEIGSFMGKSTVCFGLGAVKYAKIYALDTFSGNEKDFKLGVQFKSKSFFDKFETNLLKFGVRKKVTPVVGYSQEIGKTWNKKIDLLFIDGSHLYEDVKKDFELFYKWLKPGGIVAFHDVTPGFPGVYRVWKNIASKKLISVGHMHSLSFGFKRGGKNKQYYDQKVQEILGYYSNKIFVVIPVHNRLHLTIKCLKSIEKQTYKKFKTIVVDDGSTDGTPDYIRKHFKWVKIIQGNGNWWWSKSMNKGVETAFKEIRPGDFILSMNNDCFFDKNYFRNIIRSSQENGRAVTGSLILDAHDKKRVIDAGVHIVWQKGLIYGVADKISKDIKFYTDRKFIKDQDTLPGKGTLIPAEVFNKIGKFRSHLLPHYIGDYEFFCRAKKYNYDLIVSSSAKLYNFSDQTGYWNEKSIKKIDYKTRLNLMFGRKSKSNIIDYTIFVLLSCPKKYLMQNLAIALRKFLSYSSTLHKILILRHDIPIYVKQNKIIKLAFGSNGKPRKIKR